MAAAVTVSGCGSGADTRRAAPPSSVASVASDTVEWLGCAARFGDSGGSCRASIRRGRALLENTRDSLPDHVGNNLRCMSCHLHDGRRLLTGPLTGVYARYPRFVDRAGAVVSIEQRVNYCFTRSLAGTRLLPDSRDMHDIVSYLAYLSTGIPRGSHMRGEGTPALTQLASDPARGAALYGPQCAACHGSHGQGTQSAPALWGPHSFTIGAGLARESRTAAFIRRNMPNDHPGTLTDQQAYDVAAYILSKPRPDLPGKGDDGRRATRPRCAVRYARTCGLSSGAADPTNG